MQEEASKDRSVTKGYVAFLALDGRGRTGEDGEDGRRHAAGTGPSGHLSWADRAKQQAEGGGGRWISRRSLD